MDLQRELAMRFARRMGAARVIADMGYGFAFIKAPRLKGDEAPLSLRGAEKAAAFGCGWQRGWGAALRRADSVA